MAQETVEQAAGGGALAEEEPRVFLEGPVRTNAERPALVVGDHHAEKSCRYRPMGAGADLVDYRMGRPSAAVRSPPQTVVGQTGVEGLDAVGGGEVANPLPGVDRLVPDGDEQVGLPRPRRPTRHRFSLAAVRSSEARYSNGAVGTAEVSAVELLKGLWHREGAHVQAAQGVPRLLNHRVMKRPMSCLPFLCLSIPGSGIQWPAVPPRIKRDGVTIWARPIRPRPVQGGANLKSIDVPLPEMVDGLADTVTTEGLPTAESHTRDQ